MNTLHSKLQHYVAGEGRGGGPSMLYLGEGGGGGGGGGGFCRHCKVRSSGIQWKSPWGIHIILLVLIKRLNIAPVFRISPYIIVKLWLCFMIVLVC